MTAMDRINAHRRRPEAHEPLDLADRLRQVRANERGISLIMVAVSMTAFLGASMLAIDVGQLMTARTQAQSAADAGALAGATALNFNSYTDHSSSGPAVSSALDAARANLVIGAPPAITPADVTFPTDPVTGDSDLVQVTVYRTADRGNAISTLIAGFFGMPTVSVSATATAAARPANTETCVLPWTIPDKWIEKQCPPELCDDAGNTWDPTDTFDINATQGTHQNAGAPLANPDVYVPPGQANATGYSYGEVGLKLVLKPSSQNEVTPSFYNAWDIGGVTGASAYSNNIAGCNPASVPMGLVMAPETGNMVGATQQGTSALIASDQNAHWDSVCACVKGSDTSRYKVSPRIRPVPLYDPVVYANDQHSGKSQPTLQIVNFLGVFVDSVDNQGAVTAYITKIGGHVLPGGGPSPIGGFARAIMLVH
jgi:Flp pilus assembly protein TadG